MGGYNTHMHQEHLKHQLKHRPTETPIKVTDRIADGPLTKEDISVGDMVKLIFRDLELVVRVTEYEHDEDIWGKVCGITDTTQPPPHPEEEVFYQDIPNVGDQINFMIYHIWEASE